MTTTCKRMPICVNSDIQPGFNVHNYDNGLTRLEFPIKNYSSGVDGSNTVTVGNAIFSLSVAGNLNELKSNNVAVVWFKDESILKAYVDGKELPPRQLIHRDPAFVHVIANSGSCQTR